MNRKPVFVLVVTSILGLSGCLDAQTAGFSSMGQEARVTCYAGEHLMVDTCSTGKVLNSTQSDGYRFKDRVTGRYLMVSGTCVVDYGAPCPKDSVHPGDVERK
jgi:hypothetical protein